MFVFIALRLCFFLSARVRQVKNICTVAICFHRFSKCTTLSNINVLISCRSAAEDLDESPSELDVEGGVDNRVEGTVDVTQPGESAVKPRRHVACPAVGVHYVSHKEGQPADEKHPWRGMEKGRNTKSTNKVVRKCVYYNMLKTLACSAN